mmetsp:Transcript_2317/g.5432  ORF Transcript_2317/g.5432 Transcript_2317/m.5432 type:complete len:217 (+) Transcript_2317:532-1182(+)
MNLLLLVIVVFDTLNVQSGLVWEDEPSRNKPLVASDKHCVQHGLVQQTIAHPLRNDDVHFLHWEGDLLDLALDQCDLFCKTVDANNFPRSLDNFGAVNSVHMLRASTSSEHRQNSSATADVKNNLVLEQIRVLHDGVHVCFGADFILEHFLMDSEVGIRVKIIVLARQILGAIDSSSSLPNSRNVRILHILIGLVATGTHRLLTTTTSSSAGHAEN